jgi:hypothetical protein
MKFDGYGDAASSAILLKAMIKVKLTGYPIWISISLELS